ncbi:uncharacterized protein LOC125944227 [Dermacentor silvarum]|uniref:uncharacterized protein LOC125944227 n=1 Tax=Dermacentor silvarum TaxID=543639 RepID=UPI0021015CA3|nr:uncharacterized protein LOC125944227 [Dermacentor silvarum]
MRESWVKFCRNPCLLDKTPGHLRSRVVCSLHFHESAFLRPESNLSGHVSSFISDGVSPMGCQPTTVKKSPSVGAPCTSESEARRKTKELKKKLWKQRDFNRRLQRRLQRKRQALTIEEIVRSVRLHVSPPVAALLEAQLRMKNVSRFGRRWSSQNKSFALGLYFHSPKAYRFEGLEEYNGFQGNNLCNKALVFMAKAAAR